MPSDRSVAPSPDSGRRLGALRLAAIDIDDTLIGPDRQIGSENAEAVAALREQGVRVVLASGRSHGNMVRFHRSLELGAGPVVSAHGAVVREFESGDLWLHRTIAADVVAEVTREGLARSFSVLHYRGGDVLVQARTWWTDYDESRNDEPQLLVPDLLADGGRDVSKVVWLGEPDEITRFGSEAARRYHGRMIGTLMDPGYIEFSPAGVDKSLGLAEVSRRLGVAREEVVAFGDGNNDAPMLAWAGLGVAMSHARPAALAAADLVSPPGNPETSLARAIWSLLDDRR